MSRLGSSNLILTGFLGTGKTVVGQQVAGRLGRAFVDIDSLIEEREGMSVRDILLQGGEARFRTLEAGLCRELAAQQELVIATGGGALLADANREILGASGPIVRLIASAEETVRRLGAIEDRPLLDVDERLARVTALLAERSEAYGRIPLQVDTSGLSVSQVADGLLDLTYHPAPRVIPVSHRGGQYPIYLGAGLLTQVGPLLREQRLGDQVALVTNPIVGDLYAASVVRSLEEAGFHVARCMVPDGESHKSLSTVQDLYDSFVDAGLDRRGAVLALGGGVVGDMAGFAADTYLRGVPLVQLPTTLLAMVDSSVGGKVAVDHPRGKNLVGAFKHPELVIADTGTLSTLPEAELANGLAETVKTGLIGDAALFEQIEAHGPDPLTWLVERAVRVKIAVVEEDPYEQGRRAILNLGHTFGHALELLSHYTLSHGKGVSIGLLAAARLSARLSMCDPALPARVEGVLVRLGLPTRIRDVTPAQIWEAMATDKKRRGRTIRFILLRDVGDVFVTDQVKEGDALAVLDTLMDS